jgi:hypothetical protein
VADRTNECLAAAGYGLGLAQRISLYSLENSWDSVRLLRLVVTSQPIVRSTVDRTFSDGLSINWRSITKNSNSRKPPEPVNDDHA